MSWLALLENSQSITSLYDVVPSLDDVEVSTLELDRGGPTMTISVLLNDYPSAPPTRWRTGRFNTVALRLQILGIELLRLEGWSTENRGKLTFDKSERGLHLRIAGTKLRLDCDCGWARVDGVTAYRRDTDIKAPL